MSRETIYSIIGKNVLERIKKIKLGVKRLIFEEKIVILNNGVECLIKSPEIEDANRLIDYLKITAGETDFMIRYPEEIKISYEEECNLLKSIRESHQNIMISVFIEDKLVGNAAINCVSERIKLCHRATIGIALIKEVWGMGIGTLLMNEIIDTAKRIGYEQLELEVAAENKKAIRLYEKFGFKKYGVRNNAFKLKSGLYYSEILMLKEL